MIRRLLILCVLGAMTLACGPMHPPVDTGGAGWVKLGSRSVGFKGDRDTIMVTGQEGRFRALRFEASGRAMEVWDIKVTFGNGKSFSPNVRTVFKPGSWTRRIDLPGDARIIRRIDFLYRSLGKGKKRKKRQARMHVFGLRAEKGARARPAEAPSASSGPPTVVVVKKPTTPPKVVVTTPPAPVKVIKVGPGPGGWVALGKRKVAFGGDHDTIGVTAKEGRFRALEIRVQGSPLEMFKMKVTFGNGESYSPPLKHFFKQGSWTRRLDLPPPTPSMTTTGTAPAFASPGKKRIVRKVEFWYRSVGKRSGKATVKLFGQH